MKAGQRHRKAPGWHRKQQMAIRTTVKMKCSLARDLTLTWMVVGWGLTVGWVTTTAVWKDR